MIKNHFGPRLESYASLDASQGALNHVYEAVFESDDVDLIRYWSKTLLKTLTRLCHARPPSDEHSAGFLLQLHKIVADRLRRVTDGYPVSEWLAHTLTRIEKESATLAEYADWSSAAACALGNVLRAADPEEILPIMQVQSTAFRIRKSIVESLASLQGSSAGET
ncbi:hypothetical protein [Streptomyces sp. NPDC048419]|uniref:hypothetical protein n=1 Tax=Streptomyces sp. NPDC048419 TaxID=3365547 RepID=UPI00371DE581